METLAQKWNLKAVRTNVRVSFAQAIAKAVVVLCVNSLAKLWRRLGEERGAKFG